MKKSVLSVSFAILSSIALSSCNNEEDIINVPVDESPTVSTTRISMDEARADLESLLDDLDRANSRGLETHSRRRIKSSYSRPIATPGSRSEETDSAVIYVFNFEDEEGYAIMSGDTTLPSLISLTESGSLEEGDVIDDPGVAKFLEGMEGYHNDQKQNLAQAVVIETTIGASSYDVYGEWENIVYHQNGVCPVKWGQEEPYNKYCPLKDGEQTVTGCVATAIAQLMAIYKYPQSYHGYTFSWEDMTYSKYGAFCSLKGQDDIARLMQQLGLKDNLDVDYGVKESGADPDHIVRTLRSFGYSKPGVLEEYSTNKVIEDLKNGYGVLIGGKSKKKITKVLGITVCVTYEGGHRWLAHGLLERRRTVAHYSGNVCLSRSYESQWYPLCNWGWGWGGGYYFSGAFDAYNGLVYQESEPSSRDEETTVEGTDGNYQYKITAVTGIRK